MKREYGEARDAVGRLAVQHVVNTLGLDGAAADRILRGMTVAELIELAGSVAELTRRIRQQMVDRHLIAPGWTDDPGSFRAWLATELRLAGCEIRTLSPEGMAKVTVEHMIQDGWEVQQTQHNTT
jgi:hypothetical protein